jgi:ABC-2 type transport system permease protein
MSAQTNAVSEAGFGAETIAEPRLRRTRPVYWSLRRELWENRSIYIAPLAAAALVILAMVYGVFHAVGTVRHGDRMAIDVQQQCTVTGVVIMAATFLVAVFYCLDALYGERKDRSVLFWRSLPVSDTVTVLAKASVPIVILPVVTFVIAVVTQWIVLAMDAAHSGASVIGNVPVLKMQAALLYHLIAVHSLWYAPIYAWLLLISSWARRTPILWAILPPLAIEIVEKIAFNTDHVARFLGYRFSEGPSGAVFEMQKDGPMHSMAQATPGQFLVSPGLWGGLFVAGLFLAGAVWLRRYRSAN